MFEYLVGFMVGIAFAPVIKRSQLKIKFPLLNNGSAAYTIEMKPYVYNGKEFMGVKVFGTQEEKNKLDDPLIWLMESAGYGHISGSPGDHTFRRDT
jgi:hypothetical protein